MPGRPCQTDEPRSVIYRVRLSPAEAEALKRMNISFNVLLRSIAAGVIEQEKQNAREGLRKAS